MPLDHHFQRVPCKGKHAHAAWCHLRESVILGASRKTSVNQWVLGHSGEERGARDFLTHNYPTDVSDAIIKRLVDEDRKRDVVICSACAPYINAGALEQPADAMRLCDYVVDPVYVGPGLADGASVPGSANTKKQQGGELRREVQHERWHESRVVSADLHVDVADGVNAASSSSENSQPQARVHVLGYSVHELAPAVAALTDHEEMVLALVHPLIQVYTIPRTGQLAYVGHICKLPLEGYEILVFATNSAGRHAFRAYTAQEIQEPSCWERIIQSRRAQIASRLRVVEAAQPVLLPGRVEGGGSGSVGSRGCRSRRSAGERYVARPGAASREGSISLVDGICSDPPGVWGRRLSYRGSLGEDARGRGGRERR